MVTKKKASSFLFLCAPDRRKDQPILVNKASGQALVKKPNKGVNKYSSSLCSIIY